MLSIWKLSRCVNFIKTAGRPLKCKLNPPTSTLSTLAANTSATFETTPYKLYKLDQGPPGEAECSRVQALQYLDWLKRIRRMETTAGNMYKEKLIKGFCHLYSGQEAIAVGLEAALQPGDAVITAYRCHGIALVRGLSMHSIIAELAQRKTGCSQGKGGSMHLYKEDFYGGNGIVGAQVPLGAGIALGFKHRNQPNVSVAMYGDGAANQGQVFEAYNIAKLWSLPVIFICENNKYGMGTSADRASANIDYYTRGDYVPGLWVDGMDVLTVREAMKFARNWCVSGNGPILIETETYRYHGHSMSDPGTSYRTRDEITAVRKGRDPITLFENQIIEAGLLSADEVKDMEKRIRQEADKILEQSLNDPHPALDDVYTHIHAAPPVVDDKPWRVRGTDSMTWVQPKE